MTFGKWTWLTSLIKWMKNDDYRFMLTVIDVFSRWAWAQPVLTKSGPDVVKAPQGLCFAGQARVGLTKYRQTGDLNFGTNMSRSY